MSQKNKKFKFKTKKEKLEIKVKDLLLSSTSHGLPNIFRTQRKSIKIMWLILFALFSTVGTYMVYSTINNYLKYEVVTKLEVIYQKPAEFPAITISNLRNPKKEIKLQDAILVCTFNDELCDEKDFETINNYGFYSYKFKRNYSMNAGPFNGLLLLFYLGNEKSDGIGLDGIQIIVHNHSSDSGFYLGSSDKGSAASPGYATNFEIKRIYSFKLNEPFSSCLKDTVSINSFDSDLYRYILQSTNYSYNQKDCFEYCKGREINKYLNITNEIDHWKSIITKRLKNFNSLELFKVTKQNFDKICSKECPLECDSVKYDLSISFTKLIVERIVSLSNELGGIANPKFKMLTEKDSQDLVFVNVFYKDLDYTSISQLPKMDFFDLVSNIGGNLGLFIGVSFLSFAEIIEFIIEVVYILFESKRSLII